MKRLLVRESQVQPLLVVFEDLHWIDSETQALLDGLVESLPAARLLLLVNYRPEYQHRWGSRTYYTQLRLDPLPPESAEELLDALLGDTRWRRHDATKFVHLGSSTIDQYVCIARADAPVKSFKELLTRELIIGASQPGTSTRDYPAMLNNLTGTKIRLVSGYPGTREITLAKPDNPLPAFTYDEVKQYSAVDPEMPIPMNKLAWLRDLLVTTGNLTKPIDLDAFVDGDVRAKALQLNK